MYKATVEMTLTQPVTLGMERKATEIAGRLQSSGALKHHTHSKEQLHLEIEGEATATDFLVQFEKQLRQEIGKEFKTGIKETIIKKYTVTEELETMPCKGITVPFVREIAFCGNAVQLIYENAPFAWVKEHYVEKTFKLIKDKIRMQAYEGKDEYKEYIWEGKQRTIAATEDPAVRLEKTGWIKRTEAKGQFVYGREFTALMNVMRELFIEHVLAPLQFYEATFPKFEPWSIPKASGHAKNIYPNAYFVSVPKNGSEEYWEEVRDLFAITGEVPVEQVVERATCVGILSYAQCPPFWPLLENKIIDEETLPLLVYDWSGPTYRNESGGTHGLDRIEEFHRTEFLFVGTREQVIKTWQNLKDALIRLFDEVLDIEIRVAKVTPWWMAHAGIRTASESADVGTFDFDAYLPYRGDRSKEWLEIQNASSNGDKYPRAFRVKGKRGEYLWSGCAGHSLERVITAFLAQKGTDPACWPAVVRERFLQKTSGMKTLRYC